ncbi:hypothetical protein ACSISS_005316, partial [Klebsiella pneumoniae]
QGRNGNFNVFLFSAREEKHFVKVMKGNPLKASDIFIINQGNSGFGTEHYSLPKKQVGLNINLITTSSPKVTFGPMYTPATR